MDDFSFGRSTQELPIQRTELNRLTVRFEEDLEEDFQDSVQDALLRSHRSGLVVLGLVCAVFALLDWLIMPELRYLVWSVRFLGIMPFAIIAFLLTYWRPAQAYSGFLAVSCLLFSSAATLAMVLFAPPTVSGAYFAGLLLHIMLCFGIFRLDFLASLICGLVILGAYNGGMLMFGSFTKETLLMHNFIFITGTALGAVQAYTRNQMVRELYLATSGSVQPPLQRTAPAAPPAVEPPVLTPEPEAVPEILKEGIFQTLEVEMLSRKAESAEREQAVVEENQRLEQELRDAGRLFNLFMERISDVVWFADPEGRFVYVSPSAERVWGHSPKELHRKNFRELLTRESYEYFNAEISAANRVSGGSVRPIDLEFVTKTRVVRSGETVALAFSNHETFGSGIIGVTRDMSYRRKTEQELKKFNEELQGLIKQRSGELEDTLKRLRTLEEVMKTPEEPERLEEPPVIRYLRGNLDALQRQILQLQGATRQLQGIYSIKAMRKEDLEEYLKWVEKLSLKLDSGLQDSIDHLNGETSAETPKPRLLPAGFRFRLGDYIEQVMIGFGSRFKKGGHMVEIDCPDELEVFGEPELYSRMLQALVSYSLDIGLAGTRRGEISVHATESTEGWEIRYRDNGKGLTAEALDQLFERPYQADTGEGGLHEARDIVRDHLDGEFRLMTENGGLVFEIFIPKDREAIA